LVGPSEWAKRKEVVEVVAVVPETIKVAPAVEPMIAAEAMSHTHAAIAAVVHRERLAAEAATATEAATVVHDEWGSTADMTATKAAAHMSATKAAAAAHMTAAAAAASH
jgi:hypothetical protein